MPKRRSARASVRGSGKAPSPGPPASWSEYLPVLVAVVLALPCLSIHYLWDDFDLVQRGSELSLRSLAPDPSVVFYRPLSRTLLFWPIAQLGPKGWIGAHALGMGLLAWVVVMTQRLATRLHGARAGFYAGLLFAGMGALPTLVGWVSAVQDLLAILFVLLALNAQLSGRWWLAALLTACGVLSKETAIVLMPLVASARWFGDLKPSLLKRSWLTHAVLAAVWVAIHPGMRALSSRGFSSGEGRYIGLASSGLWESIGQSLLSTLNLPFPGARLQWPAWVTLSWIVALALAAIAWRFRLVPRPERPGSRPRGTTYRGVAFSVSLALLPIVSTALLVRNWNPYYACFAAPGTALLFGPLLARARRAVGLLAFAAFATLGVLSRGAVVDPSMTVERNLKATSVTLERLDAEMKRAIPDPEPRSTIYVGCDAPARTGIPQHLYRFQSPRTWYGDSSLRIRSPEQRERTTGAEYLLWVSGDQKVVRLDRGDTVGGELSVGEAGGAQRVVRSYAIGFAMSGEHQRAAEILLGVPYPADYPEDFNRRIASVLLDAGGYESQASALRDSLRVLDGDTGAMLAIAALLEMPLGGGGYVANVLESFNVPLDDEQRIRGLMRWFAARNYLSMAYSIANILLRVRPGDEEALAVEKQFRSRPRQEQIVTPAEGAARPW